MLYGLSGSSGVGKTSLATKLSENLGIEFKPTSITESARRHGFEAVGVLSHRERILLQWHLLEDLIELIETSARPLIVDRTPLDLIGYMACEFDMHSHLLCGPEELESVQKYIEVCLKATERYFDYVYLLDQLPTYELAPTRPADNRAYQTHCHLVMEGALFRLYGKVNLMRVPALSLDKRVELVENSIAARLDEIEEERKTNPIYH